MTSSDTKEAYARRFAVHVGVDTGKTFHKPVARARAKARLNVVRVDVSREGFDSAERYLAQSFPGVRALFVVRTPGMPYTMRKSPHSTGACEPAAIVRHRC